MTELRISQSGTEWLVRVEGDELVVGQVDGDDVRWSDDRVPLADLGEEARTALQAGRTDDAAVGVAVRGILTAEVERGA